MKFLYTFILCIFSFTLYAQYSLSIDNNIDFISDDVDNRKKNILFTTQGALYTTVLIGLDRLWYADYPRSRFHFINDNMEWNQMDKIGHATASYHIGLVGIKAYKWGGMNRKEAIWYGGLSGSFFLTAVEVLDGFSEEWGASSGDLIANSFGSALVISQELIWNQQKIQLKYSYSPSKWASKNPSVLGNNHLERALKDYNGQNYWLSFNVKSLFYIENSQFPDWLALSLGYGSDGMISGYSEGDDNQRIRQYLFSLDVDLSRIKTKNKLLNNIIHTFGFLKFPFPTLEFSNGNFHSHLIYY